MVLGLAQREFAPRDEPPPLPFLQRVLEEFFLFLWKRALFGLGIFTFHSLPQIGGICPIPDSDALSSQASTNAHHPGRENNKPFLGRICMSPPSLSDCSIVEARRQMEQSLSRLNWCGAGSAPPWGLTSKYFLGQT